MFGGRETLGSKRSNPLPPSENHESCSGVSGGLSCLHWWNHQPCQGHLLHSPGPEGDQRIVHCEQCFCGGRLSPGMSSLPAGRYRCEWWICWTLLPPVMTPGGEMSVSRFQGTWWWTGRCNLRLVFHSPGQEGNCRVHDWWEHNPLPGTSVDFTPAGTTTPTSHESHGNAKNSASSLPVGDWWILRSPSSGGSDSLPDHCS